MIKDILPHIFFLQKKIPHILPLKFDFSNIQGCDESPRLPPAELYYLRVLRAFAVK
jgi:hypothetical protein